MPDNISFAGYGPYRLPVAQRATAASLNGSVEVRLYALFEGELRPMIIQMSPNIARDFATQLSAAASAA
jgi:hypothetical protein